MSTSAELSFGLYDTTAKADSTPAAADAQPFVDLSSLRLSGLSPPAVATLEQDFFLLDGNTEPFPDDAAAEPWGYWGLSMSDADGVFAAPPVLRLDFGENHASLGLTLTFGAADWPSAITVRWYNGGGYLMTQARYAPDGPVWRFENKVEGFRRIEIQFDRTSRPYRYAKLTGLEYGVTRVFTGAELLSASILEEADPISSEIRVNTMDFRLHSKEAAFSVLNPQGVFSLLQQGQRIDAAELVNGVEHYLGAYYLDTWKNEDEYTISMQAVDAIGKSENVDFAGGMFDGVPAGELAAAVFGSAGLPYELDATLAAVPAAGWLPVSSVRDAVQQLAFAVGAVVDCSRSDRVRLYPTPERPSSLITKARKFAGPTVEVRALVTGADVTAHAYAPGTETAELFSGALTPGSYDVVFDGPVRDLIVTGAAITESNANHAVLTVTATGTVTLTGSRYADSTLVVRRRMASVPAGASPNVLQVKEATLVGRDNAAGVAGRVYEYHQRRYATTFSMVAGAEKLCDMVLVESVRNEKLRGLIESMRLDLTGGFVASVTVVGVRVETINAYRAGELYAGESMGVI